MYARDGSTIVVFAGHPEGKRWWRNLRRPVHVSVRLRGRDHEGLGRLVAERAEIERGLTLYLARFPRAGRSFGVPLDGRRRPHASAPRQAAASTLMVAIELGADARAGRRSLSSAVVASREGWNR